MPMSIILDILVAVLLVVTIGYAVVLNKRLGSLRGDREELERLARGFIETTERAETGIGELRSMTDILDERIKRAESLRDDLLFLMERGNSAADRLEVVVRDARDQDPVVGAKKTEPQPAQPAPDAAAKLGDANDAPRDLLVADQAERIATDEVSDAERELLKALRSSG